MIINAFVLNNIIIIINIAFMKLFKKLMIIIIVSLFHNNNPKHCLVLTRFIASLVLWLAYEAV